MSKRYFPSYVLSLVLLCTAYSPVAQSSAFINLDYHAYFRNHVNLLKNQLSAYLISEGERDKAAIVAETKVIIDSEIPIFAIAYAFFEDQREIRISEDWLVALSKHIHLIQHYVPTDYTQYHSNSNDYNLATDREGQSVNAYVIQMRLINLAINDILLHEFGHHVNNAFYSSTGSFYQQFRAEETAEHWSLVTKEQLLFDDYGFGKFITLTTALLDITIENRMHSNDFRLNHLKRMFSSACQGSNHPLMLENCQNVFIAQSTTFL